MQRSCNHSMRGHHHKYCITLWSGPNKATSFFFNKVNIPFQGGPIRLEETFEKGWEEGSKFFKAVGVQLEIQTLKFPLIRDLLRVASLGGAMVAPTGAGRVGEPSRRRRRSGRPTPRFALSSPCVRLATSCLPIPLRTQQSTAH